MLAQLLNLVFQVRILQIAAPKIRARRGEFAKQHTYLLARIGECALADARSHIPFLLPQFHGVNAKVSVSPQLLEMRPRRVVVGIHGLLSESQRLLPEAHRSVRDFGRQAGKCHRIPRVEGGLILPEPAHRLRDRGG